MRNFRNSSVFDDTLPGADGQMEIASNVPVDRLKGDGGIGSGVKDIWRRTQV
jgi:hypothetical protein